VFRNILVPVDLTEKNRAATSAALELADSEGGVVHLLHVIETIRGIEFEQLKGFYEELHAKAESTMQQWVGELSSAGSNVRMTVVYGRRAAEIVAYADDKGCDLIVLASHRVDEERPAAGLGTISHQVALVAGCAVLLLR